MIHKLLWMFCSLKSSAFLLRPPVAAFQRWHSAPESTVQIGVEAHCQISTERKAFCDCRRETSVSSSPNQHICPICTGEPGSLPLPNMGAVQSGARVALALNCHLSERVTFDRKNYFYPDMPKSYQITQYRHPIGKSGYMMLSSGVVKYCVLCPHN
jgi:aspartyl-tRNA(Asn)/glutamyl-tRNA(Gln) amidotransferase subunit B